MNRDNMLSRIEGRREAWDILIVGGGATGVGIAVDAASRGYDVLLLEQSDFGKGTSSRSTKLVHGGVRYLQQGNISLVMEALKERGILRNNAPHLVHDQPFIVPNYDWWETPFYGIGMKVYDMLAGQYGFGRSKILTLEETLDILNKAEADGLVLQPSNSQDITNICCCCGDCCQILINLKRHPQPAIMASSPFVVEVDQDACTGCETCLDRCQMNALSVEAETVSLDADRCIGCGLCVSTCPDEALTLVRKPDDQQPQVPKNSMEAHTMRARARADANADLISKFRRHKLI